MALLTPTALAAPEPAAGPDGTTAGPPPPNRAPARPPVGAPAERRLRIVPWPDPLVEGSGVDVLGPYVELFWLPVLGPSATWLLRRLVAGLRARPHGFHLDLEEAARSLGLGGVGGRRSPFRRALLRCARYGVARHQGSDVLAVRLVVGPVPERHLLRLPLPLQEQHRRWLARERPDTIDDVRRRARSLALHLVAAGTVDRADVERHLVRSGVHPAVAYETATWATGRRDPPSPRASPVVPPQSA